MKKLSFLIVIVSLLLSCNDDATEPIEEQSQIDMSDFYVYTSIETDDLTSKNSNSATTQHCYTMNVLNKKLIKNPGLEKKMYAIEYHTRKLIAAKKPSGTGNGNGNGNGGGNGGGDPAPTPYVGKITIQVVINIIENNLGNVTQAQIDSQIDILNEDFNNLNPNRSNLPNEFSDELTDANITFIIFSINRKLSSKSSWGTNDAMKDAGQGGIDATNTSKYLNIWVCNIGGGILGYAQFPGGAANTDGVVIGSDYFGETTAGGEYGHGRTATHEVGHWLNLRHIWGDGRCRQDDFVSDTPSSDRANYGCPSYPTVHCRTNDMTMNYMDYVNDNCMYLFTNGQNDRMRTLFAAGGAKESFVN